MTIIEYEDDPTTTLGFFLDSLYRTLAFSYLSSNSLELFFFLCIMLLSYRTKVALYYLFLRSGLLFSNTMTHLKKKSDSGRPNFRRGGLFRSFFAIWTFFFFRSAVYYNSTSNHWHQVVLNTPFCGVFFWLTEVDERCWNQIRKIRQGIRFPVVPTGAGQTDK